MNKKANKRKRSAQRRAQEASVVSLTSDVKKDISLAIDAVGRPTAPSGRASAGLILEEVSSEGPAEDRPAKPKLRAAFYVDGFNLYHGINDADLPFLKWLNLRAIAEALIERKEEIVKIVWCTAIPKDNAKAKRHHAYRNALCPNTTGIRTELLLKLCGK